MIISTCTYMYACVNKHIHACISLVAETMQSGAHRGRSQRLDLEAAGTYLSPNTDTLELYWLSKSHHIKNNQGSANVRQSHMSSYIKSPHRRPTVVLIQNQQQQRVWGNINSLGRQMRLRPRGYIQVPQQQCARMRNTEQRT